MMARVFYSLVTLLLYTSCSSSYFLCETNSEVPLYYSKSFNSEKIILIPKESQVIVKGKSKYRKVKYNNTIGWTYKPVFKSEKKYTQKGVFKVSKKEKIPSYHSGGTIYVKGYYRKDGTYVRPYTRRKS